MPLIRLEEQLIMMLAKLEMTEAEMEAARELVRDKKLNWSRMLQLLFTHRIALVVYRNMLRAKLFREIHGRWKHILEMYRVGNAARNSFIYDAISPILNDIYDAGIKCIPLKGTYLNYTVYDDPGLRFSNDIDLFVHEKDLAEVQRIIASHGYIQGEMDERINEIVPASRQEIMFQRMTTHEIFEYAKKVDHPYCSHISLDVQFDIFSRAKNIRVPFSTEHLFDTATSISLHDGKVRCYSMKPEYTLLQLASHLFQDATMVQGILDGKSHEISKYVDLHEFVCKHREAIDWALFEEEVRASGANRLLYYALHMAEQIFGAFVPHGFLESIRPDDLSYLDQYGFEEQQPFTWSKPFLMRLFDMDLVEEVKRLDPEQLAETLRYRQMFTARKK